MEHALCQETEAQSIGETSALHAELTVQLQPSCKNDRATTASAKTLIARARESRDESASTRDHATLEHSFRRCDDRGRTLPPAARVPRQLIKI